MNQITVRGQFDKIFRNHRDQMVFSVYINSGKSKTVHFIMEGRPPDHRFTKGDYIDVKGHVSAFQYEDDIRQRSVYMQNMILDEASLAKTEMEERFGIVGGSFGPHHFKLYVEGSVLSIDELNPTTGSIWIQEGENKIRMLFFMERKDLLTELDHGDPVAAIATLRVREQEEGRKLIRSEYLVMEDILQLPKEENA